MTAITDIVTVTVNVADAQLTRTGFGTVLLVGNIESAVFATRVQTFNSIDEVTALFATTTDVHKAASAFFSQSPRPGSMKIGRQEAGDADLAEALVAIVAEDDDWYFLALTDHADADLIDARDFIQSRVKYAVVETSAAAAKVAQGTAAISGITRSGQTATATTGAPHGLSPGDLVNVSGADQSEYNGTFVTVTASGSEFTYLVTGSPVTPSTGTELWAPGDVISLFNTAGNTRITVLWHQAADTEFPAIAWSGGQASTDPGSSTWNFKQLIGITGSAIANLTATEESYILGNKGNVYSFIGATGVAATREGTAASGRFIDVQRSIDWIQTRISEAIVTILLNAPKVPYTDKGAGILVADIGGVMDQGIGFEMLGPLDTSESGEFFTIFAPKVADQSPANKTARNFPGIVVTAQFSGAIHTVAITVNVSV